MLTECTTDGLVALIQYGFAGFSVLLLCVVVWLINQLLGVLKENSRVIQEITLAITSLNDATSDVQRELLELRRQCIATQCQRESRHDRDGDHDGDRKSFPANLVPGCA